MLTFVCRLTFSLVLIMRQSNGWTRLDGYSACESAINAGNKVCYNSDTIYVLCGTTEVTGVCDHTAFLCSDNAIFTSTSQKTASVCKRNSGTSVSIDYRFTSRTINDEITAYGYAQSVIYLSSCTYGCSANFTVKVNSVTNSNLYFSTEASTLITLSQKAYKEGKTGGEYNYSLGASNSINVYMLPTINDSSQKMTANYTITLADCGFYLVRYYSDSGLNFSNGDSSHCIKNTTTSTTNDSTKESLRTIDIVLIVVISIAILCLCLAFLLLIVVMLIMNHKLRTELRGYDLQPKKDEREEIEIQKPTNEDRQNTDSLVNVEFGP